MGIFDQVKQAMQMRSEAKRIQQEIEKISVDYSNGGITVTAKGDFTISKISISPETWTEAASGKHERFETMLFNVVNGALKNVKKTTQERMAQLMQSGGMGNLFGK
ncbi:MAG: YbaB/EbfC family nucleoid-associated protein [Kiritimatiellae bacterium]|nr:YbaB/EbfC family nucleoid-associated protein [Kiritimatiellia bacterium]MBR6588179.1 YbaB/EbfC family nucleoid-associated protein [Kiritimatiellia bacterium]